MHNAKISKSRVEKHESATHVVYFCPGCEEIHSVVDRSEPHDDGPSWDVSISEGGALTISPSVKVTWQYGAKDRAPKVCHSFVKNGQIQFLNDSFHKLSGKTVPMVDHDWSNW